MITSSNTYYFSIPGGVACPSPQKIIVPSRLKQEVAYVLDTNICIDIEDASNNKLNEKNTERLTDLIIRIAEHDAHIVPSLGLFERALNKTTLSFDWERYKRHCYAFPDEWTKVVNKLTLGMAPRYQITALDEATTKAFHALFMRDFEPAYASFLKIIYINFIHNSLSPIEKLKIYLDWMLNDLDMVILFPLQTAICIFAGDLSGTRMLNLKKKHPLDVAWGAAYDQFLIMVTHMYHLTQVVNKPISIFVSNDEASASVMEMTKTRVAITDGNEIVTTANEITFDFPAYKDLTPIEGLIDAITERQRTGIPQHNFPKIHSASKTLISEVAKAFPR